jgi:hypothetical protein
VVDNLGVYVDEMKVWEVLLKWVKYSVSYFQMVALETIFLVDELGLEKDCLCEELSDWLVTIWRY